MQIMKINSISLVECRQPLNEMRQDNAAHATRAVHLDTRTGLTKCISISLAYGVQ